MAVTRTFVNLAVTLGVDMNGGDIFVTVLRNGGGTPLTVHFTGLKFAGTVIGVFAAVTFFGTPGGLTLPGVHPPDQFDLQVQSIAVVNAQGNPIDMPLTATVGLAA